MEKEAESPSVKSSLFNKQNYVPREEWKAANPKIKKKLKTPVPYVVLSYTHSLACETKGACLTRVLDVQTCNIDSCHLPDIKANFLIGGDGRVYEGRGWRNAPQKHDTYDPLKPINNKCIEIAFICKNGTTPGEHMGEAAAMVIQEGINKNLISKHVKVTTIWGKNILPKALKKIKNLRISRHVENNDYLYLLS